MATIKDIATRLGVSISTVSKGLNGASDISEELRQTVLDTAVEMGYSTKRSRKVENRKLALFIENMNYESIDEFGYDVVLGFKQNAFKHKWDVDIIPATPQLQAEEISAMGLSGGQQQRLCIARALAVQPEVLLMDEPTSALDPISTSKIEELMEDLKKKYTVVVVTHNMQQAVRVSDDTAFFLVGDMVEFGDTKTIFSYPQDKRTEDYITGRFG